MPLQSWSCSAESQLDAGWVSLEMSSRNRSIPVCVAPRPPSSERSQARPERVDTDATFTTVNHSFRVIVAVGGDDARDTH